jgi:hypothetical protein
VEVEGLPDSSMSCRKQSEYIMVSSTANINDTLDKISIAIQTAKRASMNIDQVWNGNIFSCIAFGENINCTINLSMPNANSKLNALLKLIDLKAKVFVAVKPIKSFKVLFLATKTGKQYNFQTEVTAENEEKAKVAGRSELLAEGLNPFLFKAPVVTVVRPIQGVA